jgi:Tfp pilus assembly pilus retraction ATPase PilT
MQQLCNNKCINVVTLEDPKEYNYSPDSKAIIEQREKIFDFDEFST